MFLDFYHKNFSKLPALPRFSYNKKIPQISPSVRMKSAGFYICA